MIVVLLALAGACLEVLRGGGSARVHFLEGPYQVRISATGTGPYWQLETYRADRLTGAHVVDERAFLATVLRAARTVLQVCDAQGKRSRDAEGLRAAVAALVAAGGSPRGDEHT